MFAEVLKIALDCHGYSKIIQNGFATRGIYPFNANAPNYNVLKKKSNKKRNASETVLENERESNADGCDNRKLLRLLKEKIIPSDTLDSFKVHASSQPWSGDLSEQSLFNCWRGLTELCGIYH